MHLIILLGSLLPGILAIKCSEIKRRPQTQPPSYRSSQVKPSRTRFLKHDKANIIYNNEIPEVCGEALRVATYNIHYHDDTHVVKNNTPMIKSDLEKFNPTAIIFQEVETAGPKRDEFEAMLDSLGFVHRMEGMDKTSVLGNMIASRYPLKEIGMKKLGSERTVLAAGLTVGGNKVAIMGTHLEVDSAAAREDEAKQIMKFLETHVIPEYDAYVFGGDMNAHWGSNTVQTFVKSGKFGEIFNTAKAPYPKYTCWAGTAIDFMFVSPKLYSKILGAYNFHTDSSDHLPLMVDIQLNQEKKELARPTTGASRAQGKWQGRGITWGVIAMCLVIVLSGGVYYFVIRRS